MNLEEYFKQAVELPQDIKSGQGLSSSEQAFLEKYMGQNWREGLKASGLSSPVEVESVPGFSGPTQEVRKEAGKPQEELFNSESLAEREQLQLVSFMISGQEFSVPIETVQEVIRRVEPTKLPSAPDFIAGIVNLRGRVTPLIEPRLLLDLSGEAEDSRFIIVCRYAGLCLGLMVKSIATMHRVKSVDVEWGIESSVGVGAALLAGLLKLEGRLIKIISVERLFEQVLRR